MKRRVFWLCILIGFSLIVGLLVSAPQLLHKAHPDYRGISIHLNSDEAVYLARVQESLSRRPEQTAEAFIGDQELLGSQVAFIEKWYGKFFAFTGWKAAMVLDALDFIVPVFLFLSLFLFLRIAGFSPLYALIGSSAFCLLQLYNLGRPIHMRSSFLLMLWALIAISFTTRRWRVATDQRYRWLGMVFGGVLLGLLVGVYFWSFTFAWAFWGLYTTWEICEWGYQKWQKSHKKQSRLRRALQSVFHVIRLRRPKMQIEKWHILVLIGLIGIIAALPSISHFSKMMSHPFYDYALFRSGMHPGRLPESLPYSVLFAAMSVSLLALLIRHYQMLRPYRGACVMIFTTLIYMHQNMVHGITFNFVSHGIFSMALAAICVVLLTLRLRHKLLWLGCCAAIIYLCAIGYDGRYVLNQWTVRDDQYVDQHLAEAIAVLDTLPRGRILSDPRTLAIVAGYTHHDVVYSIYLKNVLMMHEELAQRYCLTQLPLPPDMRDIQNTRHLIFPDASAAFGPEVRAEEVRIVEHACRELDLDPARHITFYDVDYVLWNRKQAADWNLERLALQLERVDSGEDWILFKIIAPI